LDYHLAEKDANRGTFEGFLIDDVILGDYIFQSEGVTSKREVIFKIVKGQLIEGSGPMDEEGVCILNTDHVTYTPNMPSSNTKCPKYIRAKGQNTKFKFQTPKTNNQPSTTNNHKPQTLNLKP